jgi:uncharacterized membrane protein YoaK (UPF0700 family)
MAFTQAIWLFPTVYLLHIAEEYPRFILWAQQHASKSYTQRQYVEIHLAGVIAALLVAAVLSWYPHRWLIFAAFALALAPSLLMNAVFHAGASIITRSYCPGVVTSVFLYVPAFGLLLNAARREHWLGWQSIGAALACAAIFHTWEVGHNVFKRW